MARALIVRIVTKPTTEVKAQTLKIARAECVRPRTSLRTSKQRAFVQWDCIGLVGLRRVLENVSATPHLYIGFVSNSDRIAKR